MIAADNLPEDPAREVRQITRCAEAHLRAMGTINTIEMPAENETTLGVAFVEVRDGQEAQKAIRLTYLPRFGQVPRLQGQLLRGGEKVGLLTRAIHTPSKPEFGQG